MIYGVLFFACHSFKICELFSLFFPIRSKYFSLYWKSYIYQRKVLLGDKADKLIGSHVFVYIHRFSLLKELHKPYSRSKNANAKVAFAVEWNRAVLVSNTSLCRGSRGSWNSWRGQLFLYSSQGGRIPSFWLSYISSWDDTLLFKYVTHNLQSKRLRYTAWLIYVSG